MRTCSKFVLESKHKKKLSGNANFFWGVLKAKSFSKVCYHHLENHKKTKLPFFFFSLNRIVLTPTAGQTAILTVSMDQLLWWKKQDRASPDRNVFGEGCSVYIAWLVTKTGITISQVALKWVHRDVSSSKRSSSVYLHNWKKTYPCSSENETM